MDEDFDGEEFEPLECVALPVTIEAHDVEVGGSSTVRRSSGRWAASTQSPAVRCPMS
jgi:hypothetical protein